MQIQSPNKRLQQLPSRCVAEITLSALHPITALWLVKYTF